VAFLPKSLSPRALRALSARWQRRVIFVAGGVIVGAAAALLALGADAAQRYFAEFVARWPYAPLVVTPLGFGLAAAVMRGVFPNTQGSGIPQAIAARELKSPAARAALVGPRIAVGKVLLTLFGLLVGASIGREGPTVQVGASLMFSVGRLSPRRQPGLILAGAAAGVAAAFNTPLAGIVFAVEEMSRSFEARTSGLVLATVILAGITSIAILGDYTYFGTTTTMLAFGINWLAVPVCGVIGGFSGGLFSRILVLLAKGLPGRIGHAIKANPIPFAALCGLLVALCGIASHGAVYGTGYEQARSLLHAGSQSTLYAPLKFAATTLSSISGIPGGIFSPSLSVGAGLGADIAPLFPHASMGAIVLLGMVSYFTGVVRAPITAFVIVSEMTGNHAMLVPLMATALIADGCSRLVSREGVYHALSHQFLAEPPH
jgi:H+/Cl- antiporter ClcA